MPYSIAELKRERFTIFAERSLGDDATNVIDDWDSAEVEEKNRLERAVGVASDFWTIDDELAIFAEEDWIRDPGPRSQNRWKNRNTGKLKYSVENPGKGKKKATAAKPASNPRQEKSERAKTKEPWEMTQAEFKADRISALPADHFANRPHAKASFGIDASTRHEEIVKQAIAAGKTVPPEVLADYPNLKTKPAAKIETPHSWTPANLVKQLKKASNGMRGRSALKTAAETGWVTNAAFLFKGTESDIATIKAAIPADDQQAAMELDRLTSIIPKDKGTPAQIKEIVPEDTAFQRDFKYYRVDIDDGTKVDVNAGFLDTIRKRYPEATASVHVLGKDHWAYKALVLKVAGEAIGVIVTVPTIEDSKKKEEETQARRKADRERREKDEKERREKREAEERERHAATMKKFDDFGSDMTPMQRASAHKALMRNMNFRGKVMSRQEIVKSMISEGAKVVNRYSTRGLQLPNESFLSESQLSKTAMDYAEHLLAKK